MAEFIQNFNWWSLIDIAVFLLISIFVILFFQRRNSLRLAIFFAIYTLVYVGVSVANALVGNGFLYITKKIFGYASILIIVIFVVVYQSDFKVIAHKLAHGKFGDKDNSDLSEEKLVASAGEIVKACQNMAKNDVGALILIIRTTVPDHLLDSGTALDAQVSSGLLESIFSTKGPLHDGAVVIKDDKLLSAGCYVKISQDEEISKDLGTRHRAAYGITQESDVLAVVVSEETGIISICDSGKMTRYMTPEKLLEEIKKAYGIVAQPKKNEKNKKRRFSL